MYLNSFDLMQAERRFSDTPNRLRVVATVDNLREWADSNSDGWAYWSRPRNAAAPLVDLITASSHIVLDAMVKADVQPKVVKRAASPLKRFCTMAQRSGIMTAADASRILAPLDMVEEVCH